ncbi:MAG TPA: protein kinase [Candidatus Paceibacterota bacterium]
MQTLTVDFQKRYDIAEVLNCFNGGQKTVYIIKDKSGKKMAMKVFIDCTSRDIQELDILSRFNSVDGISKIIKIEDYQGKPILFEEYIDAPDLQDIMNSYQGDVSKVKDLIKNVAHILKPIWVERIIHRDLKPKNIKILESNKPVILDFGIARDLSAQSLTATGDSQPMSWDYAAPEQYSRDKNTISYRTDFFSLGVIAYRLYYQKHPFGNTKAEIEQKFLSKNNIFDLIPNDSLNNFFLATLMINPSGRPRNVEMLVKTL